MKILAFCAMLIASPAFAINLDSPVKSLDGKEILNTIVTNGKSEDAPPLTLKDVLLISTLIPVSDNPQRSPSLEDQITVSLLHEKIFQAKGDINFLAEETVLLKKQIAGRGFNSELFLAVMKALDPAFGAKK